MGIPLQHHGGNPRHIKAGEDDPLNSTCVRRKKLDMLIPFSEGGGGEKKGKNEKWLETGQVGNCRGGRWVPRRLKEIH